MNLRTRFSCVLGALVVVSTSVLPLAAAQSAAPSVSASTIAIPQVERVGTGDGLDTLAGCVNSNGHLIVEVLFDASGSLGTTDPQALRVPALKAALGSLLSLANTAPSTEGGKPPVVEVEMSLFDDTYRGGEGFRQLDSSSIGSFLDRAESFRDENKGPWTDYVLALEGANASLATRAEALSAKGEKSCKAIFWFTDGGYDISGTQPGAKAYAPGVGGAQAQAMGRSAMCDKGGVADQLRQAGVVDVAVALTGSGLTGGDFDLLRSIVVGGPTCGTVDGASRMGVLLDVNDVNRLTETMLAAVSGTRGVPQTPADVCTSAPCPQQVTVTVPAGVGSFYLLTRSAPNVQRWVASPGQQPAQVDVGRMNIGSSSLESIQISPTTMMIDVTLDRSKPETGAWTISFVDPSDANLGARGEVDAYFFGALRPVIDPSSSIRQGEASDIIVQVVDASGTPVDLASAQRTALTLAITDPVAGTVARPTAIGPDKDGRFRASFTAAKDSQAAAMNVMASLSVVIDGGLALRPTIAESSVAVTVPVTVPSLGTTELTLPKVEGRATTRGTIEIVGPERGSGEACITGWMAGQVPEAIESVSVVESCQSVAEGSSKNLDIALKPDHQGDGYVTGFVEVRLVGSGGASDTVTKSIPVKFRAVRATSAPIQWLTALGLTALALALPLALFVLALYFLTRFRRQIRFAEVPVRIDNGVIERTDGVADPSALGPARFGDRVDGDWNYVGIDGERSFQVGRRTSFEVAVVDSLFGLSSAVIYSPSVQVVGRARHRDRLRRRDGAAVSLELTGEWAFAVESIGFPPTEDMFGTTPQSLESEVPSRSVVTGSVLMFIDDWNGWEQRADELAMDVRGTLPTALEPLIDAAWKTHRESARSGGTGDSLVSSGIGSGLTNSLGSALHDPYGPPVGGTTPPDPYSDGPSDLPPSPWA